MIIYFSAVVYGSMFQNKDILFSVVSLPVDSVDRISPSLSAVFSRLHMCVRAYLTSGLCVDQINTRSAGS